MRDEGGAGTKAASPLACWRERGANCRPRPLCHPVASGRRERGARVAWKVTRWFIAYYPHPLPLSRKRARGADSHHKKLAAILALDAVFAQYGRLTLAARFDWKSRSA